MKFFATPPVHGSLAKFVDHPEDFCFTLPDSLSYEEGAMIEPLSNGIHACKRAGVGPGKSVAILGAGPMGESMQSFSSQLSGSHVNLMQDCHENSNTAFSMCQTSAGSCAFK